MARDGSEDQMQFAIVEWVTVERLREMLSYDPDSGVFTWKKARGGRYVGRKAGTICKSGYAYIWIDGKSYRASRLAWFYMTGAWPSQQIDHIDRRRSNDRFTNLRQADNSLNMANRKAQIQHNKKKIWLGERATPQEAHQLYLEAAASLFGEFARAA